MQTLPTFTGSSTTGIAANLLNRRFLGIDMEEKFLQMSKARKEEIDPPANARNTLISLRNKPQDKDIRVLGSTGIFLLSFYYCLL